MFKFPNDIVNKFHIIFFILILFSFTTFAQQLAQDKSQMEKERAELQQEINAIQKDYKLIKGKAKASLGELNAITKQINLQERYINNINKELRLIDGDIYINNLEIGRLKKQLDTLKVQYTRSVVYAYKNRSNYDYLNFIFSAVSFNDAMKRITYLKQYRDYREKQVERIKETQALITQRQTKQLLKKQEKGAALNNQSSQMTELSRQKGKKAKIVNELKSQEKDLLKQLNAKRKRDKDMKNALNAILKRIEKENRIAKKKEENKDKGNITSKPITPVLTDKPTTSVAKSKEVKSSIELNSGDTKLSGEFQQNKGRLPWPVDNGYVSIHFGKYEVEELKDIVGESSGITILTDNSGQQVKAIFDGEVVDILDLGDSKAVFVKHGKYLTTYGKLSSVSVSKGDKVSTGRVLGRTGSADSGTGGQIDFMLLIGTKEQNPELWLKPRR